jgi:phenol 2-monooxygenase
MPEFWRQSSKQRKLSRVDISLQRAESVDPYRSITPKSSYSSSSYSAKDFSIFLAQERSHQKRLERVETQETLQLFNPLRQSPPSPPPPISSDVLVVGAGPAGLMLAYAILSIACSSGSNIKCRCNLIRFGINAEIIDNRHEKTSTGRADSLQPKTIETLKQMRLADRILTKAVKVHDVRCWVS